MALGDLMASRFAHSSSVVVSNHLDECLSRQDDVELYRQSETASISGGEANINGYSSTSAFTATCMVYLPQAVVLCELRHEAFEDSFPTGPAESGLVSKFRPKERVRLPTFFYFLPTFFYFLPN